jgi:TonB family protein
VDFRQFDFSGYATYQALSHAARFRSRIAAGLGGDVKSYRVFPLVVVAALLVATGLSAGRAQEGNQSQKQDGTSKQATELKLIKSTPAEYPEEALKKNIEGKVTLRITVNANGRVSDAKALSGPPELFQAALDCVKQWEFEPPAHAPVVSIAEITFGHPKKCPGPVSEFGEVSASETLRSEKGTIVQVSDDVHWELPVYSAEDRKAGVAGEMILSLTVNAEGKVASVRVVKSLSPDLDNAAVDSVRTLKFKLQSGNLDSLPDDFPLRILFQPTCSMDYKPN